MTEHLWPFLRLRATTDEALVEAYRRVYIETYVMTGDGKEVEILDWMGNRVLFRPGTFNHAFSESTDYRFGGGSHDIPFSKRRARRILWIKEVLAASKGCIERRHQYRKDSRGRSTKRRVLIVVEERYIVVLEERKEQKELEFVTAFPADESYLKKMRQEGGLMEIKKPQS